MVGEAYFADEYIGGVDLKRKDGELRSKGLRLGTKRFCGEEPTTI